MIYEKEEKYMSRRNKLGVTNRDLANAIGIKPSTLASKMSGYSPFHNDERKLLETYFAKTEKEKMKNG